MDTKTTPKGLRYRNLDSISNGCYLDDQSAMGDDILANRVAYVLLGMFERDVAALISDVLQYRWDNFRFSP